MMNVVGHDIPLSPHYTQAGWATTLPWLYYDASALTVTTSEGIDMSVAFKSSSGRKGAAYSQMVYRLVKFALDGTFLGVQDLATQLTYCNVSVPFTDLGAGSGWVPVGNARW
jgi:hypothetical protein